MKGTTFLFCLATLLCIENARALALQIDYMDGYKTRIDLLSPIFVLSSSGILKSHSSIFYPSNMNKIFNVSAPFGYSLVVSIRLIDLRPSNLDQLTIFDTRGDVRPLNFTNNYYIRNRRYYPKEDTTFYSPRGQVGIQFKTGPSTFNNGYDGFELVYTVVGNGLNCNYGDFHCNNGRCIGSELKCDDHNHCGDQSSLKNCTRYIGPGRNIGISIGVIFLIIAAACGIFMAVRRARGDSTDSQTIITTHPPPTTNLPSYPPAYPQQPGTYYPPPPPPYSQGIANPTYH